MKKVTLALVLMCFPMMASAGLFGASNRDECVLEKMKGQPSKVIGYARKVCLAEFPAKKTVAKPPIKKEVKYVPRKFWEFSGEGVLKQCKNDLKSDAEHLGSTGCHTLITGVTSAAIIIFTMHPESRLFCFPKGGIVVDKLMRIAVNYMERHQEDLNDFPGSAHVLKSLAESYPCKQTPQQ